MCERMYLVYRSFRSSMHFPLYIFFEQYFCAIVFMVQLRDVFVDFI